MMIGFGKLGWERFEVTAELVIPDERGAVDNIIAAERVRDIVEVGARLKFFIPSRAGLAAVTDACAPKVLEGAWWIGREAIGSDGVHAVDIEQLLARQVVKVGVGRLCVRHARLSLCRQKATTHMARGAC